MGTLTKDEFIETLLGHKPRPNQNILILWVEDELSFATLPPGLVDALVKYSRCQDKVQKAVDLHKIIEWFIDPAALAALQHFRLG